MDGCVCAIHNPDYGFEVDWLEDDSVSSRLAGLRPNPKPPSSAWPRQPFAPNVAERDLLFGMTDRHRSLPWAQFSLSLSLSEMMMNMRDWFYDLLTSRGEKWEQNIPVAVVGSCLRFLDWGWGSNINNNQSNSNQSINHARLGANYEAKISSSSSIRGVVIID